MQITDETIDRFRARMEADYDEVLSFAEAKGRYLELLNLFWLLSHKAPKPGEPPYEPPPPPWL